MMFIFTDKPGDASLSHYTPVMVGGAFSLKCSVNDPGRFCFGVP